MIIQSARFGALNVKEQDLFKFPQGIPGFENEKEFVFVPFESDSPFSFLQSASNPRLTFVIVDPFIFFPDYEFQIDDAVVSEFGFTADNPPKIFSIVTVPEQVAKITANLMGPLLVNWRDRLAIQYVLAKTEYNYTTRHLLFPNGLPQPSEGEGR